MKSVLLTGSTGGIGEAIAAKFASQAYHVIAPTRSDLDLANEESIYDYLAFLNNEIDVFVHCAGINFPKKIDELTEHDIQKTFQLNTLSFYIICRALSNVFQQKNNGHIVGISSIYGQLSRQGRLVYATSKHALNGMIRSLAIEMGAYNVKVNAVAPGFIDTRLTRQNNSEEMIEGLKRNIPLARLGSPAEIAELVYFLSSPQNTYISGQSIVADGGYTAGGFQA